MKVYQGFSTLHSVFIRICSYIRQYWSWNIAKLIIYQTVIFCWQLFACWSKSKYDKIRLCSQLTFFFSTVERYGNSFCFAKNFQIERLALQGCQEFPPCLSRNWNSCTCWGESGGRVCLKSARRQRSLST